MYVLLAVAAIIDLFLIVGTIVMSFYYAWKHELVPIIASTGFAWIMFFILVFIVKHNEDMMRGDPYYVTVIPGIGIGDLATWLPLVPLFIGLVLLLVAAIMQIVRMTSWLSRKSRIAPSIRSSSASE